MRARTPPTRAKATAMNGTTPAYLRSRRREQPQPSPRFGARDQRGQSPQPGLFPLGAHHPVGEGALIPGGLRLEERPGFLVGPELLLVGGAQRRVASQAPWYQRTLTYWVVSAKREETR